MKLSNTKEKDIIKTEKLEIGENIFKYNRAVIQLSNISYFNVAPMAKMAYPMWVFIGAIIGLLLLFTKQTTMIIIGLIVMGFCIYEIYRITENNNQLGEYLILALNSGEFLYFSCYNKEFLYSVENVIADCFKDENLKYSINLKDCDITYQEENMNINNTGNIVNGNDNTVNTANTGSINENNKASDAEWAQLESAFKEISAKLDTNSRAYMLAVSAQYQISRKNKSRLREIIEENISDFRNSIFSQIASAGVVEIVKRITGLSI